MISDLKKTADTVIRDNIGCTQLPEDGYANMKYPRFLPLMRSNVEQFDLEGFGHLMAMLTTTKMGMELLTMSFMPCEYVNLPYLLIDAMAAGKKRCVFVEYYGCGNENIHDANLKEVYEKYTALPDYIEKDNWYIRERAPYSLIKSGPEDVLEEMTAESVKAYLTSVKSAGYDPGYRSKLLAFRDRMIAEGTPASKTLKMLLKEEGARTFFENVVMPLRQVM